MGSENDWSCARVCLSPSWRRISDHPMSNHVVNLIRTIVPGVFLVSSIFLVRPRCLLSWTKCICWVPSQSSLSICRITFWDNFQYSAARVFISRIIVHICPSIGLDWFLESESLDRLNPFFAGVNSEWLHLKKESTPKIHTIYYLFMQLEE